MTAQVNDRVRYRDEVFNLVGWEGKGLFEPAAHGLHPVAVSTGNWLGYICEYEVAGGRLRLATLLLGLGGEERAAVERGEGPRLFDVAPRLDENGYARYEKLGRVIPYTGTITLGADFIWDMYVHMGFHPPWKYRRVHDLTFKQGRLTAEADRSADMAQMREAEARGGLGALFKPLEPPPSENK